MSEGDDSNDSIAPNLSEFCDGLDNGWNSSLMMMEMATWSVVSILLGGRRNID